VGEVELGGTKEGFGRGKNGKNGEDPWVTGIRRAGFYFNFFRVTTWVDFYKLL
jgi:hypothetical protein